MFPWIYRRFPLLLALKLKTLQAFVEVVKREQPSEVVVGGRLISPGVGDDLRGDIILAVSMRSGRSAIYTENIFHELGGLEDKRMPGVLYMRIEDRIARLRLLISPSIPVRFESIWTMGPPIPITDETRAVLAKLANEK